MAQASLPKCDFFLNHQLLRHQGSKLPVIVSFNSKPTSAQMRKLALLGVDVYRHLDIIHAVAAKIPSKSLAAVNDLPFVVNLSSDDVVRKTDLFTVDNSYANLAAQRFGVSGQGIGVAVLDTGINAVDDLGGTNSTLLGFLNPGTRLAASVNFSDDSTANDLCGHGTHVAGIIAGNATDSTGSSYSESFLGIAPKANLVNVKVLDREGAGNVSSVILGLAWCILNKNLYNIRVINLSLGHPVGQTYATDPFCLAAELAYRAGIVVVCAAGNDGRLNVNRTAGASNSGYGTSYASVECPGNDPYVITVGATKQTDSNRADDQIASYSGRGPSLLDFVVKPDIVAPGNRIISTEESANSYLVQTYTSQVELAKSTYTFGNPQGWSTKYFVLSGTSMATPVTTGAVALMLQQQPNLSPDTVKARLMLGADKWVNPDGSSDVCTYGAGYLNIPAAMSCTAIATQPSASPSLSESQTGNVIVDLVGLAFGSDGLWGLGTGGLGSVYGQRALWGTGTVSNSNALWGSGFWSDNSTSIITNTSYDLSSSSVILNGEN
jgi:serine protease AprX